VRSSGVHVPVDAFPRRFLRSGAESTASSSYVRPACGLRSVCMHDAVSPGSFGHLCIVHSVHLFIRVRPGGMNPE